MSPISAAREFSIRIVTLTGTTYTFTVTPETLLVEVYLMLRRRTGIQPMEMQFLAPSNQSENSISLPRIEDNGVRRPLSDFNMFQDTTIYLIMRLGRPRPAPYRREDWFPSLERQMEDMSIEEDTVVYRF